MFGNPQPTRGTANILVEGLIAGIVSILTFVIVGALVATLALAWRGLKALYHSIRGNGENTDIIDSPPAAAMQADPMQSAMPVHRQVEAAQPMEVIEPAELKRIDLKGAFVSVRFYSATGNAKAKLTVSTKVLQKRLGCMVQLQERKTASLVEATALYREEAQALLDGAAPPPKVVAAATSPEAVAEQPVIANMEMAEFATEPFPYDQSYPDSGFYPEPMQEMVAETVAEAPVKPFKKKRTPRLKVAYRGVFLEAGSVQRNKGKRSFNHFRVLLHDDKLGADIPLWGVDLERAIEEAGVSPGDRIEAGIVGDTEVLIHGSAKEKVIWSVTKI